jgi:signal transduction histidine kinase
MNLRPTDVTALFTVLSRDPTPWFRNGTFLLAMLALLVIQTALLILLVVQIRRRRRSELAVRRLTRRVISGSEEERSRIARELHDDIGQRLSLISIQLGLCASQLAEDGYVTAELNGSLRDVDALITDVHNLSHQLHSSKLEHLGLRVALKELCQQMSERHDLPIDLQIDHGSVRVPQDISLCFYRVAQEALNNIIKHSGTDRAQLILLEEQGRLRMQVRDFGSGFKLGNSSVGLGLSTMQERLRIIRGDLSVASKPGRGTVITAMADIAPQNLARRATDA